MQDLIERLEKATGPDGRLDTQIALAVAADNWPAYTASIDAALTLVPEGNFAEICTGPNPWAQSGGDDVESWKDVSWAATPAIALCIAALKARCALIPEMGEPTGTQWSSQ